MHFINKIASKMISANPPGPTILPEPLEPRCFLSTAITWPAAPFQKGNYRATIYANQNGDALLDNQLLSRVRPFGGYEIYFDDPGTLAFKTTGRTHTQIAYYTRPGRPLAVGDSGGRGSPSLIATVPDDKRMLYLGVLANGLHTPRTYGLKIDGPRQEIEKIPVSRTNDAGSSGSDISGANDVDFYQFTTTRAANWIVKVIPDRISGYSTPRLDPTLNIYDSEGIPVGGTFTETINRGGPGDTERWAGVGLRADATYYIRVDGFNDSVGGYGVSVEIADLPTVTIAATKPNPSKPKSDSTQFVVTRSDSTADPLKVSYTIKATDVAGKPLKPRFASVIIPADSDSATIIVPSANNPAPNPQTVTVTLRPSPRYNVGSHWKAAAIATNPKPSSAKTAAAKARPAKAIAYQGPITITAGGTYTGNWQSLNPNLPAVNVQTNDPVVILNSNIRSAGILITSSGDAANLTVRNTRGYALNPNVRGLHPGRFIDIDGFVNVVVQNSYLEGTSGIYLCNYVGNHTPAQSVKILRNQALNIDGRFSDGKGGFLTGPDDNYFVQFFQANRLHDLVGAEVAWNEIVNRPGKSRVEENISIHDSSGTPASPFLIHDNYIQGAYAADPIHDATYTGGGIMVSDNGSAYIRAYKNQIVSTSNQGIIITSGHDNAFYSNRILSSGYLANGKRIAAQNVGAAIWNYNSEPTFASNSAYNNLIGWMLNGQQNNAFAPDATIWNHQDYPGAVTLTTEKSERTFWQAKLTKARIKPGPTS